MRYVIFSLVETWESGSPMFWSNQDGWGPLSAATRFPSTNYDLPTIGSDDAAWVLESPSKEE